MTSKIIIIGDVNGQLQPVFGKVAALHSQNAFTFALITGNLFLEDDEDVAALLDGRITVPLPTYFTVGSRALPKAVVEKIEKNEEICNNLHYLDKRSTTKTSEGVKIVTLGGTLDESLIGRSEDTSLPFHSIADAKVLHGAHSADILLTTTWPASIRRGSKIIIPETLSSPTGQEHISDLCAALKPRYHFSSSHCYFEREPFFHAQDAPELKPLTRFIALGPFGNKLKQKSLYAFTLSKAIDQSAPFPVGTTTSPFKSNGQKRQAQNTYYQNTNDNRGHKPKRARGDNWRPKPGPNECFFCLAASHREHHLVASIGDEAYIALAKGPLTTSSTYSSLGLKCPAHILITPLTHSATISQVPREDDSMKNTFTEMLKFKSALQVMVADQSNNKVGSVTYEISLSDGVHVHWQFLPVPADLVRKGLVEAAFRVEAENLQYPAFEVRDPGMGMGEGDFFRAWIWTPPNEDNLQGGTKCITMAFDSSIRFSLQFGRIVMAKLLGLEKRLQWRDCAQSKEEETQDAEAFKEAFKAFEFN